MPTVEARLERLERRVERIESRFNDVLEAIAERWSSLSQDARDAIGHVMKGDPPEERDGDEEPR